MYNDLRQMLETSNHIVFFGGAGVSTESGIPDFRSENGIYSTINEYGRSPENMTSHSFFRENPDMFFEYYKKNMVHLSASPNPAHYALARLESQGKLFAVITQNIDGLHQKAGSRTVYEVHGSVLRNFCMDCGEFHDAAYIMDSAHCRGSVPFCRRCGGIVKPDVVLYQEALDQDVINLAIHAINTADTLIVGGTSLVVYPAAGFLDYFHGRNLILINKSHTSYDNRANLVIHASIGEVLGSAIL